MIFINLINCLARSQKSFQSKTSIMIIIILAGIILAACAQVEPEQPAADQVEIETSTQSPTSTATPAADDPPTSTVPPPTKTPKPTNSPTPAATATDAIYKERISVPRDENLIRGTLLGDGELAVVLAPMFNESRGRWLKFAEHIAPLGYAAVAFDFPGPAGSSTGEFKFDQVQFDALAVINHLKDMGYERIVCMGASIGASACFEAARIDPDLAGIVLISAPVETTAEDTAGLLMPKLLITGDEADVVDSLRGAYEIMPEPKQYVFINQKAHGTEMLNTDDQLRDILVAFLDGIN
jgi:pimeloyl-ACP methyl ester carboxylesterase